MDAILGFIQSNIVIFGFVIGLLIKYVPRLRFIPNTLIPYANALIALLAQLFGPAEAHAGIGGIALGGVNIFLNAGWDAIKSALIYEVFGRHPLEKGLGWKKA